ncbi:VIT1/CCC1 transporter family protein [Lacipirellula parvula]|uniref:Nodulin-related protein n=1 Tax=Lacipirellula parvula TaxID=2650471 RepID=A0A5K7X8V3_9BACT|nr:VIT family protein [Lacipirellula parvula]BBO32297.1 nodulin-related protein [Lacipirellula parvula]
MTIRHREVHRITRIGWLRAAVLGANDGIVSTASLIVGVAAADSTRNAIVLAGVAGLVAGSASMAAGEYVSVSSQADTEQSDLAREREELAADPAGELAELTSIYMGRGLDREVAVRVAEQLTAHDALSAHAREELGITAGMEAKPVQAALTSAAAFAAGAMLPLTTAVTSPSSVLLAAVVASSLFSLALLGGVAAKIGGSKLSVGVVRVTVWGAIAMALTAAVGRAFGVNA